MYGAMSTSPTFLILENKAKEKKLNLLVYLAVTRSYSL
jgi:hypothetical protein